jgi:hypothetical protein
MKAAVYALIDPRDNEVRYIGKTFRSVHRRLRRHLSPCYLKGNTHKERWLRQLIARGLEPAVVVLETCATDEELCSAERRHIAEHRTRGVRLTNATDGGDGTAGYKRTPQAIERTRRALIGKPKSAEHRLRIGRAGRGRRASESTRALLRVVRKLPRSPLSEVHRENLSRAKGGRPFVDQHGNVYATQKGTARSLGLNVGHLNEVLHGTRTHVKGLHFRFLDRVREFPR